MIVLTATSDLRATFTKLIENMSVPVKWNGLFVVIDNCMILQGEVRSLFFHLDSRKVVTDLIDLEIPVHSIERIGDNGYVKNVINMLLYAFGKWGTIKGIRVEKDYNQLNRLFENILGEINIEPEYTKEHFRFYRQGMRIVYEDVMQCAVEHREKETEIREEESRGLWHKLIWQQTYANFVMEETSAKERNKKRLGNNFYLTGYLCPECGQKMYAVIYPVGREFVIDTKEGMVRLARAYTCSACCSFYTPRPERLLIDGDCYLMDFMGDEAAYEDYQELLGKNGDKVSNYKYNEYVNKRPSVGKSAVKKQPELLDLPELKRVMEEIGELAERDFEELFARVEEGFYPKETAEQVTEVLWKEWKNREKEAEKGKRRDRKKRIEEILEKGSRDSGEKTKENRKEPDLEEQKRIEEKIGKYKKRLQLYPRLSERQRMELVKQIKADEKLSGQTKTELLESAKRLRREDNGKRLKEKTEAAKKKNRLVMFRIFEEIEAADIEETDRKILLDMTGITRAEYEAYLQEKKEEAREHKNKAEIRTAAAEDNSVRKYVPKGTVTKTSLAGRETATAETVSLKRENAERAEQIQTKKMPGKAVRQEEEKERHMRQNEPQELYMEPEALSLIEKRLYAVQEEWKEGKEGLQEILDSLFEEMMQLSFEEGAHIYERLKEEDFLPELKADALKQLERRLADIKSEECELLVQRWKKELKEAGLGEQEHHYFYPARRVMEKEASEEETAVMDFACASYGAGMGRFEYPIWLADTSGRQPGARGMFLTPEHIFYSTLFTSYHISIFQIDHMSAMTGLFQKGLYAHLRNGEKIRLPYAVETEMLPRLAEVLDAFIKYLQEKPFSRKEVYLAEESHEEICCFRCGYIYKGLSACPKCGFKANC